jgi:hypothetical protein
MAPCCLSWSNLSLIRRNTSVSDALDTSFLLPKMSLRISKHGRSAASIFADHRSQPLGVEYKLALKSPMGTLLCTWVTTRPPENSKHNAARLKSWTSPGKCSQGSFLNKCLLSKTLDYAGVCLQARTVGGDYYDFIDVGPYRARSGHRRYRRQGDWRSSLDGQPTRLPAQPAYNRCRSSAAHPELHEAVFL